MAGQPTQISRAGHNVVYDPVNDEIWHSNPEAQAVLDGANAEKLIPDLNERLKARSVSRAATDR